ncbi:hypothetical protein CEXT_562041 [Caerostris extrusa]|uniref:Uncharacterized protein n=1 Tax=Caerostris extrusa TaxID=172846 RepID=A0AAV4XZB7_CAEEX|nr:hypothetical protein CEXT_562041 [Caerostris extrusa]
MSNPSPYQQYPAIDSSCERNPAVEGRKSFLQPTPLLSRSFNSTGQRLLNPAFSIRKNPQSNIKSISATSSIRLLTHPASEIRQWHDERSSGSSSTKLGQPAPSSLHRIISKRCLQMKDLGCAVYAETEPQRLSKIKRSAQKELWYTHLLFVENPQSNIKSIANKSLSHHQYPVIGSSCERNPAVAWRKIFWFVFDKLQQQAPSSLHRIISKPCLQMKEYLDLDCAVYAETKPQRLSKIKRSAQKELWYTHLLLVENPQSNIKSIANKSLTHHQYPVIGSSCERNPAVVWRKIFWFVFDKLQQQAPSSLHRIISKPCLQMKDLAVYVETTKIFQRSNGQPRMNSGIRIYYSQKNAFQYQIHREKSLSHQQYPAIDLSFQRNPAVAWRKISWFVFDRLQQQ